MTTLDVTAVLSSVVAQAKGDTSVLTEAAEKGGFFGTVVAVSNAIVEGWLAFLDWFGGVFEPVAKPVFLPVNRFLATVYQPWAQIFALALFVGTMVWVCFLIKPEMLNSGRENKALWTDLRLWTIVSMVPHLFVYIYFM